MAIKFPNKEEWKKRADTALTKIKVFRMFNEKYKLVGEWIGNFENDTDIDHQLVKVKNWSFIGSREMVSERIKSHLAGLYLGNSLWTCQCREDFIRSKLYMTCEKCGFTLENSPLRIPHQNEVLSWDSLDIEAEDHPVPIDDHLI